MCVCVCARENVSSVKRRMCVSAIEHYWPHPTQTTKNVYGIAVFNQPDTFQ